MKDQKLNEYSKMIKFCEATLKEHFVMKADPIKVIGLTKEIGLHDLADEFEQQLRDDAETLADIRAYHEPALKTIGNH